MKKYKHFLALGASTLALGLSQSAYAVDNTNITLNDQSVINTSNDNTFTTQIKNNIKISDSTLTNNAKFMEQNPNYVPEQKEVANQANEIKNEMQQTVFQVVKAGYIKFHELPISYKINVIQGFSSVTEDSHYDSTDNSLQLSFIPQEESKKVVQQNQSHSTEFNNLPEDVRQASLDSNDNNSIDEMHSKALNNEFTYGFENDKTLSQKIGSFNRKLVNQFVFLHELAHAVNHHVNGEKSSDSIYAYKKTTDSLNKGEISAFSAYTSDTLDENFADAYGSIMFLKLNNFSQESIDTLKQIALMRDYNTKTANKNFYNDSVEAHYSYYTLENVLSNIDKIKSTHDQKDLISLARDFSSNGTYQAYQNYGKIHNNSFSEEKQRDIAELATQYLYNDLNKDKPGFIPLKIEKAKYGNTYYSDLTNLDKEAIKNWSTNEISKYHSVFGNSDIAKALDLAHVKVEDVSKTFNLIKELQPTQDAEQLQVIKDSTPYVFLKSKIIAQNDFEKTNLPPIYQNIISSIIKYENSASKIQDVVPTMNFANTTNSNINSAVSPTFNNTNNTNSTANNQTYNVAQLIPILDGLDKKLSNQKVESYIGINTETEVATNTNNLSNKIKSLRQKREAENNETIQMQHASTVNGAQSNYKLSIKEKREKLGMISQEAQRDKDNIAQTLRASFTN